MNYEVKESFYIFQYNAKRQNHKLIHFDKGDMITESIKRRLKNPTRFLK